MMTNGSTSGASENTKPPSLSAISEKPSAVEIAGAREQDLDHQVVELLEHELPERRALVLGQLRGRNLGERARRETERSREQEDVAPC